MTLLLFVRRLLPGPTRKRPTATSKATSPQNVN